MPSRVRLLPISPERLAAGLWRALLADEPGLEVIGSAFRLDAALDLMHAADLILFSPADGVEEGVLWVRTLGGHPAAPPILAAGLPREEAVVLAYVEAGASGFVFQDESIGAVLRAIYTTCQGEAVIPPDIAPALIHRLHRLEQSYVDPLLADKVLEALTPREHDVLSLLAHGLTNPQIAGRLAIETGTVKNHVHNILEKLEADDRRRAAAYHVAASGGSVSRARA